MKIHLRFGMHRDVQLIHSAKHLIDGMVIPGHILAYQSNSTSVFVASLPNTPYIIDPMTFIFQRPKSDLLNDAGDLPPSVRQLCDAYHRSLGEKISKLPSGAALRPNLFPDIKNFCRGVLDFQLTKVKAASASSAASKYLTRYKKTKATQPRCIVPPYFRFSKHGDEWYKLSLECAEATAAIAGENEVAPVVCCNVSAAKDVDAIANDYADFSRLFVWIDNYQQSHVSVSHIQTVRRLISKLAEQGCNVETLYGGYLLILSHFDKLDAVSHGILYTQHKATSRTPGSGGVPERYYIPTFREFRSLSQTDLIFHKHPELMCDCPVCEDILAGNPDNIIRFSDKPDLLRKHFLEVRRQEIDNIGEASQKDEVATLRATYMKYDDLIRSLPNPDATIRDATMVGLEYLNNWANGFEPSTQE